MASGNATDTQFGDLHALVAESLIEQITAWKAGCLVEQKTDDEGTVFYVKVFPPALLAQAIKFLKDNGIDQPKRAGNKVDSLAKAMPTFEDDNVFPIRK